MKLLLLYILAPLIALVAIILIVKRIRSKLKPVAKLIPKKSAKKGEEKSRATAPEPSSTPSVKIALQDIFKAGFRKVREISHDNIYKLPCFLLIGSENSGKSSLVSSCKLGFPVGKPSAQEAKQPCTFWMTNLGLVVEAKESAHQLFLPHFLTAILKEMKHYRRRRPFDGIILAIPYHELLQIGKDPFDVINSKYQQFFVELNRLKKKIAFHLPLYIVVTKCDEIPGFSSLANALPATLQNQIFGWSNPKYVDTSVTKTDIEQAMSGIRSSVHRLQLEVLAKADVIKNVDNVMMLDEIIGQMQEPIFNYTSSIMNQSDHLKSFHLRGIYFTGAKNKDDTDLAYVKDLWQEKVFKEYSYAWPNEKIAFLGLSKKSPVYRFIPILLTLILLFGLWGGNLELSKKISQLEPVLNEQTGVMRQIRLDTAAKAEWTIDEQILKLIRYWSNFKSLRIVLLPSSWFNPINNKLKIIQKAGTSEIIFLSIKNSLIRALDKTAKMREKPIKNMTYPQLLAYLKFKNLNDYINKVSALTTLATVFNSISEKHALMTTDQQELIALLRFSLQKEKADLLIKILNESGFSLETIRLTDIPLNNYNAKFNENLEQISKQSIENALENWPLQVNAFDLIKKLNAISNSYATIDTLQDVSENISVLNNYLSKEPGIKIQYDAKEISPWPSLNIAIQSAYATPTFNQNLVESIEHFANNKVNTSLKQAAKLENSVFGKIFFLDNIKNRVMLTQEMIALQKVIGYYLNQNFVGAAPLGAISVVGNITWNNLGVSKIIKFLQQYQQFQKILSQQKDPSVQLLSDRLGKTVIDNELKYLIQNAYTVLPTTSEGRPINTQDLVDQAQNLTDNMPQLLKLYTDISTYEFSASQALLTNLLNKEANYLIENVDIILRNDDLYEPNSDALSSWDGENPLGYLLYNAANQSALDYYLLLQRERIIFLANTVAAPALKISSALKDHQSEIPSLIVLTKQKWAAIIDQINKYNNKNPASTLGLIERFIGTTLNTINLENCYAKTEPAALGNDYFSVTEGTIKRQIRAACHDIIHRYFVEGYAKLSVAFNSKLAGLFPFTKPSRAARANPIAFEDLLGFFYEFGDFVNKSILLLKSIDDPTNQEKVALDFLTRLSDSFKFLIIKNNGWYQAPRYTYEVFFRVNRPNEVDGNQIANWKLIVNDSKVIKEEDKDKTGVWVYGDPVELELRWAEDSPYLPVQIVGSPDAIVQDKVVSYQYKGPWGLLRMIIVHKAFKPTFLPVPYQSLLRFVILVYRVQQGVFAPKMSDYPKVIVYMGVDLKDAQTGKPVIIPNFPWVAPIFKVVPSPYIK